MIAPKLSPRESEILHFIGEGLTSKKIADQLGIKTTTVVSFRKNLILRFAVRNTAQLIRKAVHQGLI